MSNRVNSAIDDLDHEDFRQLYDDAEKYMDTGILEDDSFLRTFCVSLFPNTNIPIVTVATAVVVQVYRSLANEYMSGM